MNDTNIGNDHYPILCSINFELYAQEDYVIEIWCFPKAKWEIFRECYSELFKTVYC